MSNCKIFRNNDGSINRVFDEFGNESQLYQDTLFHVSTLVDNIPMTPPVKHYLDKGDIMNTSVSEVALGLWAYSYSNHFRDKYNITKSSLEEVSIDDIIRHIEEYYPKPVVQETTTVEQPVIKEGVEELFNANPELANEVYESLGFVTPLKALESNFEKVKERLNDFNNVFAENLGNSGLPFDYFNEVELNIDDLDLSVKNKEMFDVLYQKNKASDYLKSELTSIDKQKNPILINNKGQVVEGWHRINSLKANGVKTVKAYIPITPQQKQQALQLYSQYLDTIFPDSKVKDIVYHFSNTKIEIPDKNKFSLSANINRRKGFFGINKKVNPGINFANVEGTIPHTMLFNMENPDNGDFSVIPPIVAKDNSKDSAIIKQRGGINYYAVFEPEQIHILSSKSDIQGFKDYMTFQNSEFAKHGTYEQFREFITSKSSIEVENRLIETGKIDRLC